MSYGAITPADVTILELVLSEFTAKKSLKFLEIGVYSGSTARGVKEFCEKNSIKLDYWGIDNGSICPGETPFPEAHFIKGDSVEVFHLVPNDFDVILLDGCHCMNHVILEVLHYGPKVKVGGYLLLHDISPEIQQTMKDPHGPNIPEFHNSVNAALSMIGFPFMPWVLFRDAWMPGIKFGGMAAYAKVEKWD